jgi:putative phosphotransacetylase
MLMGPNGYFELDEGVIRAQPHVHMHPDDAAFYGVKHLDVMKLKVHGPLGMTFDNLVVRVDPSSNSKSTSIPTKATPAASSPILSAN